MCGKFFVLNVDFFLILCVFSSLTWHGLTLSFKDCRNTEYLGLLCDGGLFFGFGLDRGLFAIGHWLHVRGQFLRTVAPLFPL